MKAGVLFTILAMCINVLCMAGESGRVVFVRDNEIYTANGDGSNIRRITVDGKQKQWPKWSPDGTRIAYLTEGDMSANPKSRSKIEIISASGKHVGTAPVLVTLPDGTPVAGIRWVELIGWYDFDHVFAAGSANPYVVEYRTIDIRTGRMGGYGGGNFATCATKGQVAFWTPVFPTHRSMQLEVNDKEMGFGFPDAIDGIPDIHVPLQWTPDCQYLAFLDLRPPATLVLVRANRVEGKVRLPQEGIFHPDGLTPDGTGLLLAGSKKTLIYDFQKNTLSEAPPAIVKQVRLQRAAREGMVQKLGGTDPDWFPQGPSPGSASGE